MTQKLKHQDEGTAPCGICGATAPRGLLVELGSRMVYPKCQAAIEELDAGWLREYPDPVDVFEDELAVRLGLRRHPDLSLDEWRQVRVRYIEAHTAAR